MRKSLETLVNENSFSIELENGTYLCSDDVLKLLKLVRTTTILEVISLPAMPIYEIESLKNKILKLPQDSIKV